jgi:hypothetical protein
LLQIARIIPTAGKIRNPSFVIRLSLTYYSPALVQTLARLCKASPQARVAIAMKMRHSSEEVFFDLMADADFMKATTLEYPLPGDVEIGEETVFLHVYQYKPSM